jgi:hypothetical protein
LVKLQGLNLEVTVIKRSILYRQTDRSVLHVSGAHCDHSALDTL